MNKDEVKGGAEKVGGKIKEQFGKVTGNPVNVSKKAGMSRSKASLDRKWAR